jgi:hypothetical protein
MLMHLNENIFAGKSTIRSISLQELIGSDIPGKRQFRMQEISLLQQQVCLWVFKKPVESETVRYSRFHHNFSGKENSDAVLA